MLLTSPIKAVFCDLDGTLLNSNKLVGDRTKDAISRAIKSGMYVSIASGRCYPTVMAIAHELSLNGPIVTTNGAQIIDPTTDLPLYENSLSFDRLLPVLRALRELGATYSALGYDCCLYSEPDTFGVYTAYCDYAKRLGYSVTPMVVFNDDFSNADGYHVGKLLVGEKRPGDCRRVKEYFEAHFDFELYYSSPVLLEIMPRGIDKGTGVTKAAELLGLSREQIAVFGDFDNDLSMLAAAGLPVAMGNAEDIVKRAARHICADNDSDGIADTLDLIIAENLLLSK